MHKRSNKNNKKEETFEIIQDKIDVTKKEEIFEILTIILN